MAKENTHDGTSQPVSQQKVAKPTPATPVPAESSEVPHGFWQNPTEPLERGFECLERSERERQ